QVVGDNSFGSGDAIGAKIGVHGHRTRSFRCFFKIFSPKHFKEWRGKATPPVNASSSDRDWIATWPKNLKPHAYLQENLVGVVNKSAKTCRQGAVNNCVPIWVWGCPAWCGRCEAGWLYSAWLPCCRSPAARIACHFPSCRT